VRTTEFFHGTAHSFKPGEVVRPVYHDVAYATTSPHFARKYAHSRATEQQALFGMVYEVEPMGSVLSPGPGNDVRTAQAFRVKRFKEWA